jgi:hypothetical protein
MNSFCDNPIICFSFTVGNIISSLMCSLVHNASTHFVLQYLQVGPIMYCSHTIFEDATPELVRDFFWDFDFRRKWDHMLGYSKTLDEFPQNGTMIVHWIKKVLTNICCACVLSCLLHKSPTSFFWQFPFFCSDREYIFGGRIWESGKTYYCVTKVYLKSLLNIYFNACDIMSLHYIDVMDQARQWVRGLQ